MQTADVTTGMGRQPADLSTMVGAPAAAAERCRQLLQRAVVALAGTNGAVFASDRKGGLDHVATLHHPAAWLAGPLVQAVRTSLLGTGGGTAEVAELLPCQGVPGVYGPDLCVRLEVEGELAGALVVTGLPAQAASPTEELHRLGELPELIALSLDRVRTLATLDQRDQQLGVVRSRLDALVVESRSNHQTERERSQRLGRSLTALRQAYKATLRGLALAVEAKEDGGEDHLKRLSRYGMLLTALVASDHAQDPQFEYGFLLHDIGELMVPDFVRNKPGPLTDAEWTAVRTHPECGRSVLEGIDFLAGAREIVHCHHERWDGNGYPRGLRETEIPLGARIFRVCDAFDAMTSERPYRGAMPLKGALAQLRHGSGTQFWPDAVEAFLAIPTEVLENVAFGKADWPTRPAPGRDR
jgi:HD-GYP domain-containing protein (c-di-GMP phosphodiesterase class II)